MPHKRTVEDARPYGFGIFCLLLSGDVVALQQPGDREVVDEECPRLLLPLPHRASLASLPCVLRRRRLLSLRCIRHRRRSGTSQLRHTPIFLIPFCQKILQPPGTGRRGRRPLQLCTFLPSPAGYVLALRAPKRMRRAVLYVSQTVFALLPPSGREVSRRRATEGARALRPWIVIQKAKQPTATLQ